MHAITRAATLVGLMAGVVIGAARPLPQQSKESKEPAGIVTGRVTIGGKPAINMMVTLTPYESGPNAKAIAKANTDEDGRFSLTRVPAGRYYVQPFAPAFTSEGEASLGRSQKFVTLSDGETAEGINIDLKRGGAITGRVTDARGQPIIAEQIKLVFIDEHDQKRPLYFWNSFSQQTDDRGVYRIYGLAAGRYLVSAGVGTDDGTFRMGMGTRYYALTYHPGVTDESKATVVELPRGGEATGVDIVLGRVEKTYTATGRIVDAETGKPLANLGYGYGQLDPDQKSVRGYGQGLQSGAKGEIRLDGLYPGHYAVFTSHDAGNEYYNEPTKFEIVDTNVSGIELKARRGSVITGMVVVEGASNQDVSAKLPGLFLFLEVSSEENISSMESAVKINLDGGFRVSGIAPGEALFRLYNWGPNKSFSLLRVERDGLEQREGIKISAGEQVSGIKVVLAFGTGVIRGQIKIEGMNYPEDARAFVQVRRVGEAQSDNLHAFVDSRGHFVIEGVAPGEYELSAAGHIGRNPASVAQLKRDTRTVTVTNGAESEVTLVLKPGRRDN